jgi:hypothetical protein
VIASANADVTSRLATILRGAPLAWDDLATNEPALLRQLDDQGVTGLVYRAMEGSAAFATWPEDVRGILAEAVRATAASELLRRRQLAIALERIAALGVRALLLKGTALAYTVYEHPALRPRCDTDVLVRQADADRVREALSAVGYRQPVQCDGDLLFRQFELTLTDEFGIEHALDVHWSLSAQTVFASLFSYEELTLRAVPVAALGANAWTLDPVHALVLSCMHPIMHHRDEQRLLWIYDTHLLTSQLDRAAFERLLAIAERTRLAAVCARGLELATGHFATRVPEGVIERLRAMPVDEQPTAAYLEAGRTWRDETIANLRSLPRWRDRLKLLREIALPDPAYMLRAYGVTGSAWGKALLPALYAHRGVRGVVRVLRGKK